MIKGRAIGLAALAGGILFAAFAGEYNTIDWLKMKRQIREEQRAVERLQHEVDSLAAYADSIERNRTTQERVAREKFGMLKEGEILYVIEPVGR